MKHGDTVRAVWVDGDILTGKFVGKARGFLLVKDDKGKIHPCLPAHLQEIHVVENNQAVFVKPCRSCGRIT